MRTIAMNEVLLVETQTDNQTTGAESADQWLEKAMLGDLSSMTKLEPVKADDPAPAGDDAAHTNQPDRGTVDAGKPTGDESKTQVDEPSETKTTSETKQEAGKDIKPPRSEQRKTEIENSIRDLVAKRKTLEDEVRTMEAKARTEKPEAVQEPQIIAPPPQPRYTIDQLNGMATKYREDGNDEMLEAVRNEVERVKDYERDMKLWRVENKQALKEYYSIREHYTRQAAEKWPELARSGSEMHQTFEKLSREFPEMLNRPKGDGAYWLANVSALVVKSAKAMSLESENQTLKDEIATLKGKMQPVKQTGAPAKGKAVSSDDDPDKWLAKMIAGR